MKFELTFEYAAFLIISVIWTVQCFYREFPSYINRCYMPFLRLSWVTVALDIIGCTITNNGSILLHVPFGKSHVLYTFTDEGLLIFSQAFTSVYIFLLCCLLGIYYMFIVVWVSPRKSLNRAQRFTTDVLLTVVFLLLASDPFNHLVFVRNGNCVYMHGPLGSLIYAIEMLFCFVMVPFEVIRNCRNISRRHVAAMVFYSFLCFWGSFIQLIHPEMLLVGFVIAISLLVFKMTMRNPLEFMDRNVNAYNQQALKEYSFMSRASKLKKSVGVIHIANSEDLLIQSGYEGMYATLKEFLERLKEITGERYFFFLFQDTFVFVSNDSARTEEKLLDISSRIPSLNVKEKELQLKFYMLDDLKKIEKGGNGPFVDIDRLVEIIRFAITEDKNLNYRNPRIRMLDSAVIQNYYSRSHIYRRVSEAIEKDCFEVYLQPVMEIKSGKYVSAESLIRLRDDDGTIIPPEEFIGECERNGKIIAIGDIALKKTCEFIIKGKLRELGLKQVKINLSIVQCMQSGIASHLLSIIDSYGISHDMICFEITESFLEHSSMKLLEVMNELGSKGITFALDDYGTGYSNAERLMKLPFSEIKLDKSLIKSFFENERNQILVSHLVGMIKGYSLKVLAEGVETEGERSLIEKMGCDYIQGWYYSQALGLEDFVEKVGSVNLLPQHQ